MTSLADLATERTQPDMVKICPQSRPLVTGLLLSACALLCTPAWPVGQTLTHEQLERLLRVVDKRGSHATIPRDVASILALQPGQFAPDVKQAAYVDDDGNRHGFAPLNDGSGYFMFRSGAAMGQSVFRVDAALHLVRAAGSLLKNGPLISLPDAEARKELDDEFEHWSKVLSPGGPAAAQNPFSLKHDGPVAPAPYPFKQSEPSKP
jgi:hypothetical protein